MNVFNRFYQICFFSMLLSLCLALTGYGQNKQPVDYVDNKIGVLNKITNCVIGPQLPFGSINPSPQTPNGGDDGYDPEQPIRGFGQLQVSGTGWGTNGQIFLSPQIGLAVGEAAHDSPKSNEIAFPYLYQVTLERYHITTRVTPSYHSALYEFRFPKSDSAHIIFDITHNIPMDIRPKIGGTVSKGEVTLDSTDYRHVTGYGEYKGGFGGGKYTVFFAAHLSKMPSRVGTWLNGEVQTGNLSQTLIKQNDRVGAWVNFTTAQNERVFLRIAVSYKSIAQAEAWLDSELPDWNMKYSVAKARLTWNKNLKKIKVEGGADSDKRIFYTAMYHAHLMPRNRTNDSGQYEKDVPVWDDHFAVWDTWRTTYPLHMLISPDMVAGTINSFIERFKKNGVVRDAFINGNDMGSEQGGNDIDNIIADGYLKKIPGINWNQAYKLLSFDADHQRLGSFAWRREDSLNNTYKTKGWIPAGIMSSSMTLEYAYNDYCASEVAAGLGKADDARRYAQRSHQWLNLWNPDAESDGFRGFIVPRERNGDFVDIDLKQYPGSWKNYFYESSSWTYSWFAPHDFKKLVELNSGAERFVMKLQYGLEHGLIQYDNEPAFLAIQGFQYAGRSDLTSYWVRKLIKEKFTLEGGPGNDDSGAMSSWYIFSAIGFFPNAGQDIYYLTGPIFKKVVIHLSRGRSLTIRAPNASPENIYFKRVYLKRKRLNGSIITYDMLTNAGTISFEMSNKPL